MKKHLLAAAAFLACSTAFAQSNAGPALPTDPKALLAMAAPYYDYASADMKPWHIRYRFQYFDESGSLNAEGEFDYWWSTTKVSKASWTHDNQSHIEWRMVDGKELHAVTGNDMPSMEHRLYSALVTTFLKMTDSQSDLKYFTTEHLSQQLACAGSARRSNFQMGVAPATAATSPDSLETVWPAYCFDEHEPVLIASHENGTITNFYGQVRKFQNHNFPGRIDIAYVGTKRVGATLEDVSEVQADDAAFTPSPDATEYVPRTTTTIVPTNVVTSPL